MTDSEMMDWLQKAGHVELEDCTGFGYEFYLRLIDHNLTYFGCNLREAIKQAVEEEEEVRDGKTANRNDA